MRVPGEHAEQNTGNTHARPERWAVTALDIGVNVPQMGFSYPDLLHRARRCEDLGIGSLWLYDHLYGPGLPDLPSMEAWTWRPRC